jgi:TPR repeat protein
LFQKAAALGNAAGKNELGVMYANGICLKEDLDKAFSLWVEAAKAGDAYAADGLAQMYAVGVGPVRQNYDTASYWAHKAAAAGNVKVFCEVGIALAGRNPPDSAGAVQFFQMGVDRGSKDCAKLRDEVIAQWAPSPGPYKNHADCKYPDNWDERDQICYPADFMKDCTGFKSFLMGESLENARNICRHVWKQRVEQGQAR